jgi:hypothetical protein
MVPPSIHPQCGWLRWGGVAGTLLASAGSWDEAALSLAGWLVKAGWTDDEIETFIIGVTRAAQDEEWKLRAGKAAHTRTTHAAGRSD